MTIACVYCSGTRWLQDNPDLGPCDCVTPDNMEALEAEIGGLMMARATTAERIGAWRRYKEGFYNTAELADALEAAADALQRYLVKWGFPSDPIALRDPDLMALVRALEEHFP